MTTAALRLKYGKCAEYSTKILYKTEVKVITKFREER